VFSTSLPKRLNKQPTKTMAVLLDEGIVNEKSDLLDERTPSSLPSMMTMMMIQDAEGEQQPQQQPSLLRNFGSTARDHLANERTYLAWIRTALAMIGASIAMLKWDDSSVTNIDGYCVGCVGIVVLIVSTQQYFHNMRLLQEGKFQPNVLTPLLIVVVVTFVLVLAFAMHFKYEKL